MKRSFLGVYLLLLGIVALTFATIYTKKSYFSSDISNNKLEVKKDSLDKKIEQNQTREIERLETTILEVKRSKYLVATEVADYEYSKKLLKDSNKTKKIELSSVCKTIKKSKKRDKKEFKDSKKRLAIIMDDIGSLHQANQLKNINLHITPSIFPSTNRHPNTPKIAKGFKHYMVHLPMEAFRFNHAEEGTLEVGESLKSIKKKIAEIYKDFPKAIAFNNHTGSKFTSSAEAMDRLYCALDDYDIRFIDSKTSASSVAKRVGKIHLRSIYCRDIFLDNKPDVEYILAQIEKAVKKAKKDGVAIAICHPRSETFEALREAGYLFEDIELVYVDELY